MERWTTPAPLRLPIAFETVDRIDLEFVNVRRDLGSLTAFVFVGDEPPPEDAGRDHPSYAGSFSVFGPARCWGTDEDHCNWRKGPASPFDRRPPHHLTPINISMDVTRPVKRLGDPDAVTVTAHSFRAAELEATEGVLRFDTLTALAYR